MPASIYFLALTRPHHAGRHRLCGLVGHRHRAHRGDRLVLVPPGDRRAGPDRHRADPRRRARREPLLEDGRALRRAACPTFSSTSTSTISPKAEAFYVAAFGLKLGRRFGAGGVELLGLSSPIYLLVKARRQRRVAATGRRATIAATGRRSISTSSFTISRRRSRAPSRPARRSKSPVKSANWGKLALMADPFGHGFCLIEFVGRGYDEIATPRLGLRPSPRAAI